MIQHSYGTGNGSQIANGAWPQQARDIRSLAAHARRKGLICLGSSGVGKSQALGRLAWLDYLQGLPQVIIDPRGGCIDSFLHHVVMDLLNQPEAAWNTAWERIVYADMSAKDGYVIPWPFYYRIGTERSLWEIAARYPQVLLKSEPDLATRPLMGYAPLKKSQSTQALSRQPWDTR